MSKKLYLISICLIATLGGFLFGFDTAVISGTLSFIKVQFKLTPLLEGWYVGSALLGCIIGVAFSGILADKYGRKKTLIFSSLFLFISAAGCMFSGSMMELIIYRLVGGLGVGINSMGSPLYISEISPAKIRGRMISLYQFAITIGIVTAYFTNAQILSLEKSFSSSSNEFLMWVISQETWRGMLGSEIIPGAVFLLMLFLVPESPRWLLTQQKESKAREVLRRIVSPDAAEKEISEIKMTLNQETPGMKQLITPGIRLALFIGIALAALSQFSGINAIIYYGPKILEAAGFGVSSAINGQVIIGVVNVIFTLLAIWKIDSAGRRILLMTGYVGMFSAHLAIGYLFYTGHSEGILLMILLQFFIACFAFSFGPVVWVLLAEMYPTYIRGRAMSIATLSLWFGNYIIGQMVPWMLEKMHPYGTFWTFALMIVPAMWITWRLVPETKGKSLEEIESFWLSKGRKEAKQISLINRNKI